MKTSVPPAAGPSRGSAVANGFECDPEEFPRTEAAGTNVPMERSRRSSVPEDGELIRRFVATGDRTAFESLVRRKLPMLRRMLLAFFRGCLEEAQDAEQEILVGLFLDLHKFRGRSSFDTFLYRYARNKAVDQVRRIKRNLKKVKKLAGYLSEGVNGEGEDPSRIVGERDEADRLLNAVYELPERDRLIVLLREVEDVPVESVAEIVGLPAGTVKSRLHRLRKKLAGKVGGDKA